MFRYASMPLGPVRLLTELGRALVKRGTEGTTERLRILKSGIKGNIDDFIAGLNAAPTGASQTQPLNIPVQWNAGIGAKLPVKMVRRTVRYRAQRLQRQRLIKMARNVPTDALEAPTYAGLALISFIVSSSRHTLTERGSRFLTDLALIRRRLMARFYGSV